MSRESGKASLRLIWNFPDSLSRAVLVVQKRTPYEQLYRFFKQSLTRQRGGTNFSPRCSPRIRLIELLNFQISAKVASKDGATEMESVSWAVRCKRYLSLKFSIISHSSIIRSVFFRLSFLSLSLSFKYFNFFKQSNVPLQTIESERGDGETRKLNTIDSNA